MGVKGLAAWLARAYPDAFVVQEAPKPGRRFGDSATLRPAWAARPDGPAAAPAAFDCVYVDMASVLHTALRQGERKTRGGLAASALPVRGRHQLPPLRLQPPTGATLLCSSSPASTPSWPPPARAPRACSRWTAPRPWPSC